MDLGPKRMTTEARREQLLAFGRQHFAEHGYEAMSMDAIADRVGVSRGSSITTSETNVASIWRPSAA